MTNYIVSKKGDEKHQKMTTLTKECRYFAIRLAEWFIWWRLKVMIDYDFLRLVTKTPFSVFTWCEDTSVARKVLCIVSRNTHIYETQIIIDNYYI